MCETKARQNPENSWYPTTPDGQPVDITNPQSGTKNWEDVKKDEGRMIHRPSYPPLGASTTFWSRDADSGQERKYDVLHCLQHGRQHPAEPYLVGYSEGWDGHKVRQEDVDTYQFASVLLSQAGVDVRWLQHIGHKLVQEDLRGFNSHYAGIPGATFGLAMVMLCDDVEEAKQSTLAAEAERYDEFDIDSAQLAEYAFRKWGDAL